MALSLDIQNLKISEELASLLSEHVTKIIQVANAELSDELGQKCLDILNKESDNEATYWAIVAMMAVTVASKFSGGEEMGKLIFQTLFQLLSKMKKEREGELN